MGSRPTLFDTRGDIIFRRQGIGYAAPWDFPFPRNHRAGLVTSTAADGDHDITIAVGECRDSTNAENIILTSAITKQLDTAGGWVVATDQAGRPTGVSFTADTTYHVYVIKHADGTVDAGFDTSTTAANLLTDSGYTWYRRVASIVTDGTPDIYPYTQYGNDFYYDAAVDDVVDHKAAVSGAQTTVTMSGGAGGPVGFRYKLYLNVYAQDSTDAWWRFYPTDGADVDPSLTVAPLTEMEVAGGSTSDSRQISVWSNTSAQFYLNFVGTAPVNAMNITTVGWYDQLGDND